MIQPNIMMSREARRLLNELESLAGQYKTSTLVTPQQVYIADQITQKYYTAPILNAIKSKVKALKNRSSKHFTIEHWVSVLDSMFSSNGSVRREGSIVHVVEVDDGFLGYQSMIKYLITDYGVGDAGEIYEIVHKYSNEMIDKAISIAKQNKVYNVQYVKAVLEKEQALSNIRQQELNNLRTKVEDSNHILNRQRVEHSVLDMASTQYDWNKAKENAELERKMQELIGG